MQRVVIRNNFIDARKNKIQAGNGIVVQATSPTTLLGPILVEGNTIYGGNNIPPEITNSLSNGIYVFGNTMKDVTIRNNNVTRMGQSGLRLIGTRFTVLDNKFTDVGGGGLPGFYMAITDSRIENNTFTYTGVGPGDNGVEVGQPFSGNFIRNNPGIGWPEVAIPQDQKSAEVGRRKHRLCQTASAFSSLHCARRMASGLLVSTSALESAPTAATSSTVATTPD